jgi:hypothetical protein
VSAVWQCPGCFALHWRGEARCTRCHGLPAPLVAEHAREPETEPVLLSLPPIDFPLTRSRRPPSHVSVWFTPAVLLLLSAAIAMVWDPFARRFDAAHALGGVSLEAELARRDTLVHATRDLARLVDARDPPPPAAPAAVPASTPPPPAPLPAAPLSLAAWRADVIDVGRRASLGGATTPHPDLADLEVRLRAQLLELASLPTDADASAADVRPRLVSARAELSRISEELTHAR